MPERFTRSGHPHRHFQIHNHREGETYIDPDTWQRDNHTQEGSWWPAWHAWLAERSTGKTTPPTLGNKRHPPLADAPGTYVLMP